MWLQGYNISSCLHFWKSWSPGHAKVDILMSVCYFYWKLLDSKYQLFIRKAGAVQTVKAIFNDYYHFYPGHCEVTVNTHKGPRWPLSLLQYRLATPDVKWILLKRIRQKHFTVNISRGKCTRGGGINISYNTRNQWWSIWGNLENEFKGQSRNRNNSTVKKAEMA